MYDIKQINNITIDEEEIHGSNENKARKKVKEKKICRILSKLRAYLTNLLV